MAAGAGLSRLLEPELTAERWREEHFGPQRPLFVPRCVDQPYGGLLRLLDMDALLARAAMAESAAQVLLFEELRRVRGYASPHAAFANGASIVVNHADKVWPPANELCAELSREVRFAFANLYLTPHAAQTAPPHSDDRDVFVLQLHGRKRWRVWPADHPSGVRAAFGDEQAGKAEPLLREEDLGAAELEAELAPGSLLYVPRGVIHAASAASEPQCSLHLTVAVPTADLCWATYIQNAVADACFDGLSFRAALPLGPLPPAPPAPGLREAAEQLAGCSLAAPAGGAASAPAAAGGAAGGGELGGAAGGGELDRAWRSRFTALWEAVHRAVGPDEARLALDERMENHRRVQRQALVDVERALSVAAAGPQPVYALWPRTRLRKVVPVTLIEPPDGAAGARVVQTAPVPGGPGRLAYTHTAPELLAAVSRFHEWPVGHDFVLSDLPARHDFLRACAARALLGLGVVVLDARTAQPACPELPAGPDEPGRSVERV